VGFADRVADEGEEVLLDLHPHWKRLVLPALLVPAVVGVASYAVFLVPTGSLQAAGRWSAVGVAAAILLRWSLWPWLSWHATHYVVTDRRLIMRTGVLGRRRRDLPLSRVNDVSVHRSLGERLLRSGTLTIESAGEHGRLVLDDVPGVELVHREIYRRVHTAEDPPRP
jgi:uncharacterized membrane protein YdbT with pleckstrin-like domain